MAKILIIVNNNHSPRVTFEGNCLGENGLREELVNRQCGLWTRDNADFDEVVFLVAEHARRTGHDVRLTINGSARLPEVRDHITGWGGMTQVGEVQWRKVRDLEKGE